MAQMVSNKKRAWAAVVPVFILLLVAAACIIAGLAFSDPNADRPPPAARTDDVMRRLALSAVRNQPAELTGDEMSALMNMQINRWKTGGSVLAEGVRCGDPDAKGETRLYAPVVYRGMRLGLSGVFSIQTEGDTLLIQLHESHVGRLPVPPAWALSLAESGGMLPDSVSLRGDTLGIPLRDLRVSTLEGAVSLEISGVAASEKGFSVGTRVNLDGAREKLKEKWDSFVHLFS